MKSVALLVALVGILAVMPTTLGGPADECRRDPPAVVCQSFEVSHQGLPVLSSQPYFDTYYLWTAPGKCASPTAPDCRGTPAAPGSGVPTPAGNVGAGAFGLLYQETNGAAGLQRGFLIFGGQPYQADKMVLV